ncbi:MAG: hypothetical protein HY266_01435 [Deltaproteobacteria bacterium]|nr:hypothetical protein [Deltaproteobacteria bacterium]
MKKGILILLIIGAVFILAVIISGKSAMKWLRAEGYLEYSAQGAVELAHRKCAQCHGIDKTAKYCMRCGPPFIVVVHNMRTLIAKSKDRYGGIEDIKDGEAAAITQVWNALVGNWEDTWRKEDLQKLLENDNALIKLLNTPVKERKIEMALKGKTAAGAETIMKPVK